MNHTLANGTERVIIRGESNQRELVRDYQQALINIEEPEKPRPKKSWRIFCHMNFTSQSLMRLFSSDSKE